MTISSTTNRVSFAGNDVTVAFATSPVVFFASADLTVYTVITATGVATLKTLTTDYTVTGGSGATGTVTMLVAPATGTTLLIVRDVALTQGSDLVNNDASDAEVIEDAFDRLTMITQQLDTKVERALRLPDSDVSGSDTEFTDATTRASKVLGFDANGELTYYPTASAVTDDASVTVLRADTGSVSETLHTVVGRQFVDPEQFGAVGDGTTDDTAAFVLAAASGKKIVLQYGRTYYTGPFVLATAGQVLESFGATLKCKTASASSLIKLNAAACAVYGVTINMNSVAQTGILLNADYCTARFNTLSSCGAAAIYGSNNANFLTISQNVVKDAVTYGIYVEAVTADAYGNKIVDNLIDTSGTASASGIYLTGSNTPYTFKQYQWIVRGNRVKGSVSTPTGAGITTRAVDGICTNNHVYGYTLGITSDITTRSVITNNRVEGVAGATAYSIEVNGGLNNISGNVVKGGRYGITGSGNINMDHNAITGNVIEACTVNGIYIIPTVTTGSARYMTIAGNNINMSGVGDGTGLIYLTNDCKYVDIKNNTLRGRGSATAGTRAVYFDTGVGNANVSFNTLHGFERAVGIYSSGALAYNNIACIENDATDDVSSLTNFVAVDGSATKGTGIIVTYVPRVGRQQYNDLASNIFDYRDTSNNSPEGATTSGIASIEISQNTGRMWIKRAGTGNTGWREFATYDVGADVGDAGVTLTAHSSSPTQRYATAITADRAVALSTTGAIGGDRFRIVRMATATGAFNVNVGTGPLKAMNTAGSFCDVEYTGSAWILTAYGLL